MDSRIKSAHLLTIVFTALAPTLKIKNINFANAQTTAILILLKLYPGSAIKLCR